MAEKRLLTAPKSKLGTADLSTILRKEGAWDTLPLETREKLYALLPSPSADEPPHDPAVNPLKTTYRQYIEEELRVWQADLKDGKETKKWREEAMLAGEERKAGKFDEWKESERERSFGGVQAGAGDENGAEGSSAVNHGDLSE
ncbi:hypothetical protein LTR53_002863 [Teratosphaeriaceae sp. CCFEE 6253]|nr:hypothetical protein LTR53_002863 [Teratosphaeriaceae sp. CCFEE 6253]